MKTLKQTWNKTIPFDANINKAFGQGERNDGALAKVNTVAYPVIASQTMPQHCQSNNATALPVKQFHSIASQTINSLSTALITFKSLLLL